MPSAAVEVFITDTITLDLYKYNITLMPNGFATENATDAEGSNIRPDAVFAYKGNILITQSNVDRIVLNLANIGMSNADRAQLSAIKKNGYETAETANGISVIGGNPSFDRTVTLEKIYQKRIRKSYGIYSYSGDINFLVSGVISIDAIGTSDGSSKVTVAGKNNNSISKNTVKNDITNMDTLFLDSYNKQYDSACISGKDISISNIVILKAYNGELFGYSGEGGVVSISDSYISMSSYNGPLFTKKLGTLTITNCVVDCDTAVSNSGSIFTNVGTASFANSNVSIVYGGSVSASAPLGHASKLTLTDTIWDVKRRVSNSSTVNLESLPGKGNIPAVVELYGNSEIHSEYRLQLLEVILHDTSSIEISKSTGSAHSSFLLCKNITIKDSASITADYVIISGFTENATGDRSTETTFLDWMQKEQYIVKGGTLNVEGGTVNAKEAVGGAYGVTINISGGTVNSPIIGTLEKIYGYTAVIPEENSEFVYSYEIAPSKLNSAVNVSGGTVNVTDGGYLGGHNSTVHISGGQVKLSDGAVLGLTASQLTDAENDATSHGKNPAEEIAVSVMVNGGKVEGESASILAPYGTVTISGATTAVKVNNILAELGTVIIAKASGTYTFPTSVYNNGTLKAGVYVITELSAQRIEIKEGAFVYAASAEVVIPEGMTSTLTVTAGSNLHTQAYGASGLGADENSIDAFVTGDGTNAKNIFSAHVIVSVNYVLNITDDDPALTIENSNPTQYDQVVGEYLTISEIARYCYDFAGWYDNPEFSGNAITSLDKSNTRPVVLYAKWTPKKIKFQVIVDSESGVTDLNKSSEGIDGTLVDGVFTFTREYELEYGTKLQGSTAIDLANHALKDYAFAMMEVADSRFPIGADASIGTDTVISRDFIKAFTGGTPIQLRLLGSQKKRQKITFHIGQGTTAPKYAELADGYADSAWIDFNQTLGSGFTVNGNTILAVAPGYTFLGWSTDPDATEADEGLFNTTIKIDTPTEYYVVWQANTYTLKFDAGTGTAQVTTDSIEPDVTAPNELDVTVVYDQKIDGNIKVNNVLVSGVPYAWNKGNKFMHWKVSDGTNTVILEKTGSEWILNIDDFPMLKTQLGLVAEEPPVLTFTAVYEPVKVTYVDGGAHWVSTTSMTQDSNGNYVDKPTYGTALKGYTANTTPTDGYALFCNLGNYAVYSTTAATYQNRGFTGMDNDYRNTLYSKGHTFYGWFSSKEAAEAAASGNGTMTIGAVMMTPEYEDITVYAAWHANDYTLVLNATSGNSANYNDNTGFSNGYTTNGFTHKPGQTAPTVTVTVDDELITHGSYVNVEAWPDRAQESGNWYTYTKGQDEGNENNRRFLLGYTFAPLDPSNRTTNPTCQAAYQQYAANVTKMLNDGTLLQKGQSEFFIPDTYIMTGVNGVVDGVPDYPDGCQIQMYAVYRERSLVFIEYYLDLEGNPIETEKEAHPYYSYVDYPSRYTEPTYITSFGYSLVNWYFHNPVIKNDTLYPQSNNQEYENNLDTIAAAAVAAGSYDIKVYTVYAAQVTKDEYHMEVKEIPEANRVASSYSFKYPLPASMQSGQLKYTVENTALKFVDKDTLDDHKFDLSWDGGHTSDNTVAVRLSLYDSNDTQTPRVWVWLENGAYTFGSEYAVTKGWTIQLELYHSEVMTTDAQTLDFDITFSFTDSDLEQQWIKFEGVDVNFKASKYTVVYEASLPEAEENLTFNSNNDFTSENKYVVTEQVPVGGTLHGVPTIEGYTNVEQWYKDSVAYGAPDSGTLSTLTEADVDGINLTTKWNVSLYKLTADANTMTHWNIGYTLPAYNEANIANMPQVTENSFNGTTAVDYSSLPYHAELLFTRKTGDTSYDDFIRVNGTRLDASTLDETVTANVNVVYQDVETLYLENGTIDIEVEQYKQGAASVEWHGHYNVLMDSTNNADNDFTFNTLKLNGDLRARNIRLGNLNISSDDSIRMGASTKAKLTMYTTDATFILDNIYVPNGAELEIEGGSFTLTPSVGYAGIGGNAATPANGKITLKNGTYDLQLPASGTAAGIGSATAEANGNDISISDCDITASQGWSASSHYAGTWIGGENVNSVILTNGSTLNQAVDSTDSIDSFAIIGKNVTIDDCNLGLTGSIGSPIAATEILTVTNGSQIVQNIVSQITNRPIGYDGGKVQITNSDIKIDMQQPWYGYTDGKLYGGKLMIDDAVSDVVIADMRLIELGNGNVTVNASGYTQGSETKMHTEDYVLLGNKPCTGTTVTANGDITLRLDCQSNAISINTIGFADDLTVTGQTVANSTNNAVALTLANGLTGKGNLTFEKVNVSASGNVGSFGATDNSDATTTITIKDSALTAYTIGALGAHNKTFTLVVLEGSNTITGKLVRDHYRLEYKDVNGIEQSFIDGLNKAFRTEQTNGVGTETAVGKDLSNASNIPTGALTWYYKIGDKVYSLSVTEITGYDGFSELSSELATIATGDGNETIYIYLDMKVEVTVTVKGDRYFTEFDDGVATVTIPANGTLTALITFKGVNVTDGGYVLRFTGGTLPKDARLSLTLLKSDGTSEYYYYVAVGGEDKLDLGSFSKMGVATNTAPVFFTAKNVGKDHTDTMLVSFDFSQCEGTSTSVTVKPCFVVGNRVDGDASFSYELNTVNNGSVAVNGDTITVTVPSASVYEGKNYALIAELDGENLPYNAVVKLGDKQGTAFGGKLLFTDITAGDYMVELQGITGTFTIKWTLVVQEADSNVMGVALATDSKAYDIKTNDPYLSVTLPDSRSYEYGTEHEIILSYTDNVAEGEVKAILQKQGTWGSFNSTNVTVSVNTDNVSVQLPNNLEKGVYRISISLNGDSYNDDDNVYFTFVIH